MNANSLKKNFSKTRLSSIKPKIEQAQMNQNSFNLISKKIENPMNNQKKPLKFTGIQKK